MPRPDDEILSGYDEDVSSIRDGNALWGLTGPSFALLRHWNLGPRRGREGVIEEHIAGKWHVIALQEAIEYLQHECRTNHFYNTHFAGCAVMFNKDTFYSDITVKSIYLQTETGYIRP